MYLVVYGIVNIYDVIFGNYLGYKKMKNLDTNFCICFVMFMSSE